MKRFVFYLLCSCLGILVCSCQLAKNKKVSDISHSNSDSLQTTEQILVHLIPDSLQTTEQKKLTDLISQTLVQHITTSNNRLILNLTKRELVELGIPELYFDLIQKDLAISNSYVDSLGIQNTDSLLKV